MFCKTEIILLFGPDNKKFNLSADFLNGKSIFLIFNIYFEF